MLTTRTVYFFALVIAALLPQVNHGQIVTDGSVGAVESLSGSNVLIPETLGSRVGDNLFHSFDLFNVNSGQSATFTGASDIDNVISRVTGSESSIINGLLRSTVGEAAFYLINPNGVFFGAGAQVDVPASFYISSANSVRFNEGEMYSADLSAQSSLAFSAPVAFGFSGGTAAQVSLNNVDLEFKTGRSVYISGGEIILQDASIDNPEGHISLQTTMPASGSESVTLLFNDDLFNGDSAPLEGSITLVNSSLEVSGDVVGHVEISTAELVLDNAIIYADNNGDVDAQANSGIFIRANNMSFNGPVNAAVTTDTFAAGDAANCGDYLRHGRARR